MVLNANSKQDLEDFKTYILVEKNFSEHTAKAYYSDILSYLIWLGSDECEQANLSKMREYLHFMQKFNYKKTINVSRGTLVINKIKYYYFILYFFNFLMFHVEHEIFKFFV